MKTLFMTLAVICGIQSVSLAGTIIKEAFETLPDSPQWKVSGEVVANGKLSFLAKGDETTFVNAMINTLMPVADLNFTTAPLEIQLADVMLGGTALADKQAFIVLVGTDKTSEADASGYIRLCFNGNGGIILSVGNASSGGKTLVEKPVAFPIKKVRLLLKKEGYELEVTDASSELKVEGDWVDADMSAWKSAIPYLTVKAVRRPASGTCEASLGKLTVTKL
jgi:hypothetical protein